MFTAAANYKICLASPSQLTSSWQPNDSGTNQKFKQILSKMIKSQVTAKLEFSKNDIAAYVIKALKHPEMSATIRNSFCHVGVVPFD